MANRIRTGDPCGFNKGHSSKFRVGSRVRQTPEEGRRTYWPKRCRNNNKDEDNSPKTLNDKIIWVFVQNSLLKCTNVCSNVQWPTLNTFFSMGYSGQVTNFY